MGRPFYDIPVPWNDLCFSWNGLCGHPKRNRRLDTGIRTFGICGNHGNLWSVDQEIQHEMAGNLCTGDQYGRCNDLCGNHYSAAGIGGN